MSKVVVTEEKIIYKTMLRKQEIMLRDVVWAYRQQQDAGAVFRGKNMNLVINRVIVQDKEGNKTAFPFDKVDDAKEMLEKISKLSPHVAIGYTAENKEKFETIH